MLVVFVDHYNPHPSSKLVSTLCSQGYAGVQLFFVLSGFLITGILWDSRDKQHRFRDFYARRVLRIFPLYYGLWAVLFLLTPVAQWHWNWQWSLYLVHLGNYARFLFYNPVDVAWLDILPSGRPMVHAAYLGHLWTLCVEEQFYLLWPAVVFTCRSRERLLKICIGILVFCPLLRAALVVWAPERMLLAEIIYRSTFTQMDALIWGGLVALMLRGPEKAWLVKYASVINGILLCTVITYWFVFARFVIGAPAHQAMAIVGQLGIPSYNLLGLLLLLNAIGRSSLLGRVLSVKPLALFGTITYGFYVFHDPAHLFYETICRRFVSAAHVPIVTCIGAFLITLVFATLSFKYIETPILRLRRHFRGEVSATQVVASKSFLFKEPSA